MNASSIKYYYDGPNESVSNRIPKNGGKLEFDIFINNPARLGEMREKIFTKYLLG